MNAVSQAEIARYVEAVRVALDDLPQAERDDLLEDLPDHLAEVAAAEGSGSLEDRLGPPMAYAAELRASAGLAAPRGQKAAERLTAVVGGARRRLGVIDARTGPILGYARASDFLRLLRPAWWVLRGYLAAMAFVYVFLGNDNANGLIPRVEGNEFVGLALLVAFVVASIWLGRRSPGFGRWPRRLVLAGSALVALVGLVWFAEVDSEARNSGYYYEPVYSNPYEHINDVYVYDSTGRLLTGVRLFDQDGQPIEFTGVYCEGPEPLMGQDGQVLPYPRCPLRAPWGVTLTPPWVVQPTEPALAEPTPTGAAPSQSPSPQPAPTPTPAPRSPSASPS